VGQRKAFLQEIYSLLKPGGRFLVVEPRIHVTGSNFERTIALSEEIGFRIEARPRVQISQAVLFNK